MRKDKFYYEVLPFYQEVVSQYKKLLDTFYYQEFVISEYEVILNIEDSFLVYIGLKERYPEEDFSQKTQTYLFFRNQITNLYLIHIEELTENTLFKFIGTKFTDFFGEKGVNTYYFFNIKRFCGWKNPYGNFLTDSVCEYVDERLPSIHLRKRFEDWSGWLYYYIIYEVYDPKGNKGFCVWNTKQPNINKIALQKCKKVEKLVVMWHRDKRILPIAAYDEGFVFDNHFCSVAFSIVEHHKTSKRKQFDLHDNIKYTIIKRYIKDINDVFVVAQDLYLKALNGEFDNEEKGTYTDLPSKWKSEYLVKQLCEKIYGKENVLYQFRPYFLHTEHGQLSYDIYLPKKKIAIEYQGQQHFRPIEFFGGEESHMRQKERDELKRKLSEKNNVKLVFINYWEPITEELIKQKVKSALST